MKCRSDPIQECAHQIAHRRDQGCLELKLGSDAQLAYKVTPLQEPLVKCYKPEYILAKDLILIFGLHLVAGIYMQATTLFKRSKVYECLTINLNLPFKIKFKSKKFNYIIITQIIVPKRIVPA